MCGIAGFLGFSMLDGDALTVTAAQMGNAILHRGPDGGGIWHDCDAQVLLVHRRLAILDLSDAGHQPMVSRSGRHIIVFNGEIYNHLEIRVALEAQGGLPGGGWRGHSDTETLLAAISHWGLEAALLRATGMFALALWDRQDRALYLARDRMGEKPLYYGWQKGAFLFGSELKALRAHPAFEGVIDRNALALQLRHGYIPAPYSIYHGIRKLQPGCYLRVGLGDLTGNEPTPYWRFSDVVEQGIAAPFEGSEREAVAALDGILRNAVGRQMVADVPLGAFLSGGIDSSTIVAIMQEQSSRPVQTFTIGFEDQFYNEAVHAKKIASHLGTDHTELYISSCHALDVIPRLPHLYDEPFSDSSQIPTFLISEMTRRQVTVSLSGDGGDELFGGYSRYIEVERWWNIIDRLPHSLRKSAANGIRAVSSNHWDVLGQVISPFSANKKRWYNLGAKAAKMAKVIGSNSEAELYKQFVSHWADPASIVIGGQEPPTAITQPPVTHSNPISQMMALDSVSYLPDDILVKVDRASMAVSLETRVPFLDHSVVEFAWRLPPSMKCRAGQGKRILRQVLERYVPSQLIDRPKMGFGVPLNSWLRGPLRDWAESLLDETRLRQGAFFEPEPVRQKWTEHLSGTHDWQSQIWDVLMFQAWLEQTEALPQ